MMIEVEIEVMYLGAKEWQELTMGMRHKKDSTQSQIVMPVFLFCSSFQ